MVEGAFVADRDILDPRRLAEVRSAESRLLALSGEASAKSSVAIRRWKLFRRASVRFLKRVRVNVVWLRAQFATAPLGKNKDEGE